jgi:molybdopterin/thiamine biosynthesis adenylyltransferase
VPHDERMALKPCVWERDGEVLTVVHDPARYIELADPEGFAEALLEVLGSGGHTLATLRAALVDRGVRVDPGDLAEAVDALDSVGLVESGRVRDGAAADDRYFSNLAFFDLFSSLAVPSAVFQQRLRSAHVLQLGTGGLGSNVIQSLAGLGVGRLTLLDCDVVEPRNFARQFLYRHADIGQPKVDKAARWVRAFRPDITVTAVHRRIRRPEDLDDLLAGVDLVTSGVDQPVDVDLWVNEACLLAGTPWIRGGMSGSRLLYFSVDPGRSACMACRDRVRTTERAQSGTAGAAARLNARVERVNPAIGPVAALVGSLVAMEALRYLTGFQPPYAAGRTVLIDVRDGCAQSLEPWPRDPDCALCTYAAQQVTPAEALP